MRVDARRSPAGCRAEVFEDVDATLNESGRADPVPRLRDADVLRRHTAAIQELLAGKQEPGASSRRSGCEEATRSSRTPGLASAAQSDARALARAGRASPGRIPVPAPALVVFAAFVLVPLVHTGWTLAVRLGRHHAGDVGRARQLRAIVADPELRGRSSTCSCCSSSTRCCRWRSGCCSPALMARMRVRGLASSGPCCSSRR